MTSPSPENLPHAVNADTGLRRLIIVEFDLAELSSHFFNQALGFKLAAEELGLEPCILVGENTDAALAGLLGARRVIGFDPRASGSPDYDLDRFADGDAQLRSLWSIVETMGLSSSDLLLITSGRPIVVYSIGAWLGRLDPKCRPAVFFRFFAQDYHDQATKTFSPHSWMHRFAARDLALRPGEDRVFFTVNNSALVDPLGRLCMRRVFQMPIPKFYGEATTIADNRTGSPVIYTHLNMRCTTMLAELESLIRTILQERPDARFLVKYCRNAFDGGAYRPLSSDLFPRGVELLPTEQSHADYLSVIARSDIVLLPYDVKDYTYVASGVFSEGAALGKVMVYPGKSWMDDQVKDGCAAGVSFGATRPADISAALLQAIRSLPELSEQAQARAGSFRIQNSCKRNVEIMLSLAARNWDMRSTYTPGSSVSFGNGIHAKGYIGRGWSYPETHGIWTDGPEAELVFRCDPRPAGSLETRVLLMPFFAAGQSQVITVSVNDVELCSWTFSDEHDRAAGWRSFTIPSHVASSDELRMRLQVRHPLSPQQAGFSPDPRALGVCVSEIILLPVEDEPGI